jgi:hypothetical protein
LNVETFEILSDFLEDFLNEKQYFFHFFQNLKKFNSTKYYNILNDFLIFDCFDFNFLDWFMF